MVLIRKRMKHVRCGSHSLISIESCLFFILKIGMNEGSSLFNVRQAVHHLLTRLRNILHVGLEQGHFS